MKKNVISAGLLSAAVLGGTAACSGTVAAAPSASATSSVSASAAAPTTATAATSTATGGSSQAQGPVPNAGAYVAGGWLTLDQFPYATGYHGNYAFTAVTGTKLAGNVYRESTPLAYCNTEANGALSGLTEGSDGQQMDGVFTQGVVLGNDPRTSPIAAGGFQQTLFFPNAQDAQNALGTLPADFAYCAKHMGGYWPTTGATIVGSVHQTLDQPDAQCWSTLSQPAHGGPGTLTHYCFVQSGSLITDVVTNVNMVSSLTELDLGTVDTNLVNDLHQSLKAYSVGN